jgi:hypothetical protein
MSALHLYLPPIKAFLNAANHVLNSNTFLLKINISPDNWQTQVVDYLMSTQFDEDMFEQVAVRMRYTDSEKTYFRKKNPPRFEAIIKPKRYCYNMLAAELQSNQEIKIPFLGYGFYSPYQKTLPKEKARKITNAFFNTLFQGEDLLAAWAISPDFIMDTREARKEPKGTVLTYFYGEDGIPTDSATLLLGSKTAYILLTNGND